MVDANVKVDSSTVVVNKANVGVNLAEVKINEATVNVKSAEVNVNDANVEVNNAKININSSNVEVKGHLLTNIEPRKIIPNFSGFNYNPYFLRTNIYFL